MTRDPPGLRPYRGRDGALVRQPGGICCGAGGDHHLGRKPKKERCMPAMGMRPPKPGDHRPRASAGGAEKRLAWPGQPCALVANPPMRHHPGRQAGALRGDGIGLHQPGKDIHRRYGCRIVAAVLGKPGPVRAGKSFQLLRLRRQPAHRPEREPPVAHPAALQLDETCVAGSTHHSRVRHSQTVFGPLHVLQEPGAVEQQHTCDAGTPVESGGVIDQMSSLPLHRPSGSPATAGPASLTYATALIGIWLLL